MKKLLLLLTLALVTQMTFAQNVPSYVPTDGLVGYWPFSGNSNDASDNGTNGTVNGATLTTDRFGNSNSAFNFDGLNDFISVNPSSSLNIVNNISISLWFYTTQTGFYGYLVDRDICGISKDWSLAYNGTSILRIGDGITDQIINSGTNNINSWHNLVFVRMNDSFKLYIDGILSSQLPINGLNFQNNQTPIYFGEQVCVPNSVNSPNFKGKIDEIAIYNRALTQDEITAIYNGVEYSDTCNAVSGSLTNGLVGYWPFCGNANDDSGNGHNGTVNGATLTTDRFGNINSAYQFNASNGGISVPSFYPLSTNYTVSYWVKYDTQTINTSIMDISLSWLNLGEFVVFRELDNSISFATAGSNGASNNSFVNSATPTNTSNWYNIVGSRNGTQLSIYINGVLVGSGINNNINTGVNKTMYFGGDPIQVQANNNARFSGKLDDITIFNRALTQQEITNLYNANQCITNITVTDTLIINVGQLSFNDPVTWANNITLYPNPANTQVNISFTNITDLTGGQIKIINSLGQQVVTTPITLSGTNTTIPLTTWGGAGLYFVQIINPQGQIVDIKKIILQ